MILSIIFEDPIRRLSENKTFFPLDAEKKVLYVKINV